MKFEKIYIVFSRNSNNDMFVELVTKSKDVVNRIIDLKDEYGWTWKEYGVLA